MADDATTTTEEELTPPGVDDLDGDGVANPTYGVDLDGDGKIDDRAEVVETVRDALGEVEVLRRRKSYNAPPPEPRAADFIEQVLAARVSSAKAHLTMWQSFRRNAGLYLVIFIAGLISGITVNRALTSEEAAVPAPPAVVPASTNDALPRVVQDWLETPSTRARTRESERERFRRAWEAHTGTAWEDRP